MKFRFHPVATLPRLAWCARLKSGSETLDVFHGRNLETGPDGFFEGAWDGPYTDGAFHRAKTLSGSGARITGRDVEFCAPTDTFERIVIAVESGVLWASNSLAFLLVRMGDKLDIRHPWYLYDLLHWRRWGLRKKEKWIHTANRNRVFIYDYCNVRVNKELERCRVEKPLHPVPECFSDYRDILRNSLECLIENAGHEARKTTYSPITSISEGYDSSAVSVLAAEAGCKEAYTFVTPGPVSPRTFDSGEENARLLGLKVTSYSRYACHELPGMPEAEFQAGIPDATGMVIASAEKQLSGRLCLTGHAGEDAWELNPRYALPDLLNPDSITMWPAGECEFRLRVGYLRTSVPLIAYQHRVAIEKISRSKAMRPWSLPGQRYNRPIPRRIVEEAGIERGRFALQRQGGAFSREKWKEESWSDFMDFYRSSDIPAYFRHGWMHPIDLLAFPLDAVYELQKKYRNDFAFRSFLPFFMLSKRRSLDHRRKSARLYSAHWGFEKIRSRYEID